MATDGGATGRSRTFALIALDALAYAGLVAAATLALALVGAVVTGGGLARTKLILFIVGWLLLMVATVRLWPRSPKDVDPGAGTAAATVTPTERTRIEAAVAALPPLRYLERPSHRLSPPAKLFVGSLLVLAISLLLEVGFGVA